MFKHTRAVCDVIIPFLKKPPFNHYATMLNIIFTSFSPFKYRHIVPEMSKHFGILSVLGFGIVYAIFGDLVLELSKQTFEDMVLELFMQF